MAVCSFNDINPTFLNYIYYETNCPPTMKFILKREQMLEDVFPIAARPKIFPANGSTAKSKKLNARKFVGVIKITDNALDIQRSMRNEWNQDLD
jgi:hypothetical protein